MKKLQNHETENFRVIRGQTSAREKTAQKLKDIESGSAKQKVSRCKLKDKEVEILQRSIRRKIKTYFRLFFFFLLLQEMKSISNEKENSHQNSLLYLLRKIRFLGQESEKNQESARHLLIFECQKHF